jgi:hypothetical protein
MELSEHSETLNSLFQDYSFTALPSPSGLSPLSKTCNDVNTFSFLKIKDKNLKDSAHFLFLIIVRHPKVVTLVYSPKLTKSLTPFYLEYEKLQSLQKE